MRNVPYSTEQNSTVQFAVVYYCIVQDEDCKSFIRQGSGQACNGKPISRGVTPAEIATILDVHNNYRAKIARGEERRGSPGPQPPAANMKIMVSCEMRCEMWCEMCCKMCCEMW